MNILYPVFALFALTLAVGIRMGIARYGAVSKGAVDGRYYRLYQGGEEPPELRILSRHFSNLLETPPLFYIACLIAYVTEQTGTLTLALAWSYVALRLWHSWIHLGSNFVPMRFRVFILSMAVLTALMVVLFVGLL